MLTERLRSFKVFVKSSAANWPRSSSCGNSPKPKVFEQPKLKTLFDDKLTKARRDARIVQATRNNADESY